jgi:hypothetical protein
MRHFIRWHLPSAYTSGGNFAGSINFTVNSDAALRLGTSLLGSNNSGTNQSNGAFTLSPGANLRIGHVDGITTSGTTGNVRVTGTRNYSTEANYIYGGDFSQVTGNGLPSSVNNLRINNAAGVTLTSSIIVNGNLALIDGVVTTTADNILDRSRFY